MLHSELYYSIQLHDRALYRYDEFSQSAIMMNGWIMQEKFVLISERVESSSTSE